MITRFSCRMPSNTWITAVFRVALLFAFCAAAIFSGCRKIAPTDPMSSFYPGIIINSPKTNDTLFIGPQQVQYSLSNPASVTSYELYVNDSLKESFHTNADGSAPVISWHVDSTLEGTYAWFYLKAYDYDRNAVTSPVMTNLLVAQHPVPPPTPKNLTLWKLPPSIVALTWESGGFGARSMEVWRRSTSEPYARIQSLPGNVVSTNDSGLAPGRSYWYKIRAVNSFGIAESNEVTTAGDTTGLAPPSDLMASPLGSKLVQLTWTDNSTTELGFVVERELTGSNSYAIVGMVGPNQASYIDSVGLRPGGEYTYRVAARGPLGLSAWSNEQSVTTLFQDIYPPSDLAAIYDLSSSSVLLSWKDNSVLTIQTWIERRDDSGTGFVNLARVGTGTLTFSDSAVTHGRTYTYRVRVFTAQGYFSSFSNEATLTIPTGSATRQKVWTPVGESEAARDAQTRRSP